MNVDELNQLATEEQENQNKFEKHICVCVAAGCLSSHADKVQESLTQEVERQGLTDKIHVKGVGCMGLCSRGPLVSIEPEGTLYQYVKPEDTSEIVEKVNQEPVNRLVCSTGIPFFKRQQKVVLENSGRIDPDRIEEYVAAGGYSSLVNVLSEMTPQEVIEEVIKSGLRGRGGAGYPTGLKWSMVAKARVHGRGKFVVCNADEGDPGAFMDRSVLESDPHRVIEGMTIAAYAVGATNGYIYVRAEYPLAIKRLRNAIRQANRHGMLGNEIAGTPHQFNIELRLGAGAFVCGEETALLASIEGRRGTPRPRPPFPAESGVWDSPTLINNGETLANIPTIMAKGGDWFASIGTEKSKGTKVFALAGRVENTGLIEVPMGITLREIIFDIGGGIPGGAHFKAVQTGGPSGGCIPEAHLDAPVDYESLNSLGSIMGSGGMIVMDETSNMVDVAKFFMEFSKSESCGKCVPCRIGTAVMHDLLEKIAAGEGSERDLLMLEELCDVVKSTSLCGLGQTAPNPVLSTFRYFRDEYVSQLQVKD